MEVVDIYNMALGHLAHDQTVAATTDATAEATWCNRFYDQARKETLRLAKPNFALRTEELEDSVESDHPKWRYEFSRPYGLLGVVLVMDENGTQIDFALEGEVIYANESAGSITFIYDEEDVDLYDAIFVATLAYRLASYVALPLSGKADMKRAMEQGFVSALSDFRTSDANDTSSSGAPEKDHNYYVTARG